MNARCALALVASVFTTSLVACTGAESGPTSGSDDLRAASLLEKQLETPVAVPTDTSVGASLESVRAYWTAGWTETESRTDTSTTEGVEITETTRYWVRTGEAGYWQLRTQPVVPTADGRSCFVGYSYLQYVSADQIVITYADRTGPECAALDGRVDWIDDKGNAEEFYDDNFDGRVDEAIEAISNLEGFEVTGYDPSCTPPRVLANRILKDTDFDGAFDHEAITGDHSSWICE